MQAALAYLSMIDPEAFEIASAAVAQAPGDPEDEEPIPLCATCGAPVGIFPEVTLSWRHFRGATTASGIHQTYDPGHASKVAWYLPGGCHGKRYACRNRMSSMPRRHLGMSDQGWSCQLRHRPETHPVGHAIDTDRACPWRR
jgi:hypothetical protein